MRGGPSCPLLSLRTVLQALLAQEMDAGAVTVVRRDRLKLLSPVRLS